MTKLGVLFPELTTVETATTENLIDNLLKSMGIGVNNNE